MEIKMRYSQYKKSYGDCKTIPGTYDRESKTVMVEIPEGRIKPSGVRGGKYSYFRIPCFYEGKEIVVPCKAMSYSNAIKQIQRNFPGAVIAK